MRARPVPASAARQDSEQARCCREDAACGIRSYSGFAFAPSDERQMRPSRDLAKLAPRQANDRILAGEQGVYLFQVWKDFAHESKRDAVRFG
jgi:hypothetical protein